MKKEYSAGGVVLKYDTDDQEYLVLLCYQKKLSGKKMFCLPKGHIEQNETKERAALREVLEETGVKAEIIGHLGDITYYFSMNGEKVQKTVSFYLMKFLEETFHPNEETESIIWCKEDEALKINPFKSEQDLIKKAFTLINSLR